MFLTRKQFVLFGALGLVIVIVLSLGLGFYFGLSVKEEEFNPDTGGVVANGHECAAIGSSILQRGGSAIDAAIATLFCEGVAMPQSMGLGGGFLMTIYIRENKTAQVLDARETAPIKAEQNMFGGNASLALKGGLAVAVPGELRGYDYAHQKYGKLPWKDLVQPTIELCERGHLVTKFFAGFLKRQEEVLLNSPTLREIYIDPRTNKTYQEGQHIKRKKLAETLRIIAENKSDALYNGRLTKGFVEDITKMGGIITADDLELYQPHWKNPIVSNLPFNETLYTSPLPGSGLILTFILNVLKGFLDYNNFNTISNWQKIVESFKYAYAKRTELGDPDFLGLEIQELEKKLTSESYAASIRNRITVNQTFNDPRHYGANVTLKEDHGTAHISVLAPNGDAVSVTSTINQYFGAGFVSPSTGIILNDEMDDFSSPNITNNFGVPPSPANYIVSHKRPMSSMCPSIVVNQQGDVVLVIGAAGGTKITTSTALVMMRNLWFKEPILKANWANRLHHQLFPMTVQFEHDFDKNIIKALHELGHNISVLALDDGFAALTALSRWNGQVEGTTDRRRTGQVVLIR